MKVSGGIFGGLFISVGAAVFYFFVISTLLDALQMLFWQPAPATLISADVNSFQSRNDNGSYSTQYSLDMSYKYHVNGQKFVGNRVNIRDERISDSGILHQQLHEINIAARQNRLSVWVNPNNSTDAIYNRSVRLKHLIIMTLFASLFVYVGGGIVVATRKSPDKLPAGVTPSPDKPWTTRPEWASSTIYSDEKNKIGVIKFFAILLTLFSGMCVISLFGQHPAATGFAVTLMVPPVFLFRWYRKKKSEWEYFQSVPLKLTPYPGVIGGKVSGSLPVPTSFSDNDQYTCELICTRHWTTRSGNETTQNQTVVWSKSVKPRVSPLQKQTQVSFSIDVPADKPQSGVPDNDYHKWTLKVKSVLTGLNFNREYELPVFVTDQSQTVEDELKAEPLTLSEEANLQSRLAVTQAVESNKPIIQDTEKDLLTFQTPGSKSGWLLAGMGTLFFIIGMVIALIAESFFGYVFSTVATLFIVLGVFAVGKNCKIRVDANQLEIDVYMFSRLINMHRLAREDIVDIKAIRSSSSSTNGKQTSETFCLKVITKYGKVIDMGGEFKTMKNATYMKQKIESILTQS